MRDGKIWDTEYKPIGHELPYQRPPLHPRCRSMLQLVMKSWQELGFDGVDDLPESTRASMDGQVSEKTNYEEWLNSKTPEEQDKALGKGKADLWRRGVITFADMLDQSGRPMTLEQLSKEFDSDYLLKRVNTKAVQGVRFTPSQLQKKYKHAEDFGLSSNYSKQNAKAYQQAIISHLNDENTHYFGHYRNHSDFKVYYNAQTGIALVLNEKNQFVTVFKPTDERSPQLTNYLENGVLW